MSFHRSGHVLVSWSIRKGNETMAIDISGASSGAVPAWQARRQDFGNLATAIKSGNLPDAQQAFVALAAASSSSGASASAASISTGTTATTATSPTASGPLAAVGQALQSGNLAGAQKALAQVFAKRSGHHGHHHHVGGEAAASTTTTASATSAGGPTSATAGSIINTLA